MAQSGSAVTRELNRILQSETGLPFSIGELAEKEDYEVPPLRLSQIVVGNIAAELHEKATAVKYPSFHIYCDRVVNSLKEKFRTFSGNADMNIEIRVSHDHLDDVEKQLQLYVDAATEVLDRSRGEWQRGMYYLGGYEVVFGAVKRGGRNFLQTAKLKFTVGVSAD